MTRVLVVDDTEFMRTSIKCILEGTEFNVVGEAVDGEEAVKKYKELEPDVVLMDITMPVMTGIEALEAIKALNKEAKVIIVSALGQESVVREAVVKGATTFIVKPFKQETLLDVLTRVTK